MSEQSKPWYMLLPIGLFLTVAVGWSVFWYVSFTSAKETFAAWRERAQRSGLQLECAQQNWSGYPFRIELSCDSAHFSRIGTATDFVLSSSNITALSQVYTPGLVVMQFTGPTTFDLNPKSGDGLSMTGAHAPALASIKLAENTPTEISILIENFDGSLKVGAAESGKLTAKKINLHGRTAKSPSNGTIAYDFAGLNEDFSYDGPQRDPIDKGPISFNSFVFNTRVDKVPYPWPDKLGDTISQWAQNNGTLEITQLDLTRSPVRASMSGNLQATRAGLLDGKLKGKIVNLDKFLDRLVSVGTLSKGEASIAKNMFRLLSGNNDNAAVSTELSVKDSKIYLGPFKIGRFAPLF